MIKKWKLLETKSIFESPFITLNQEKLEKADGSIVDNYYSIKRRDVVYIVALNHLNQVFLVYQYKNGVKDLIWELPAGFVDEGEETLQAARRELKEETGAVAQEFIYLGGYTANAGSSGNLNHFFLALGTKKISQQSLDEHEEIEVELTDLAKEVEKIKNRSSRFIDSQSSLALILAFEELQRLKKI